MAGDNALDGLPIQESQKPMKTLAYAWNFRQQLWFDGESLPALRRRHTPGLHTTPPKCLLALQFCASRHRGMAHVH